MANSEPPSAPSQPVAPFLFPSDMPPAQAPSEDGYVPFDGAESKFRQELYERERQSGMPLEAHGFNRWGGDLASGLPDTPTQMAEEQRQAAESRAARGGLPDAPDDGGPRAVSSKPYRF